MDYLKQLTGNAILLDLLKYSLIVVLLFILYRLLLRFLNRKPIKQENYCTLYDLEYAYAKDEIPFYFSTEKQRNVRLFLIGPKGNEIELCNSEFSPGGHIVRFDSKTLENGNYFYCLESENQEIRKKMQICN